VGAEDGSGGVRFRVAIYGLEEREERGVVGVDGGHDGEVVLELVEVGRGVGGEGDCVVERVGERGVVGPEGHLADDVGEVEGWWWS
jgi:hypothetical protein